MPDIIDWNAELRSVEREFDGLPPEPSATELRARKTAELRARERIDHGLAVAGAVTRIVLVGALLVALYWWPYPATCGVGLATLLSAQGMVVIGGVSTAVFSWRQRFATGHVLALVLMLAGLTLVSAQVLPRTGYVRIAGMSATAWRCHATSLRIH